MNQYTIPLVTSSIGMVCSTVNCVLNSFIIFHLYGSKKESHDWRLFYFRLLLDTVIGFIVAMYTGVIVIYCINPSVIGIYKELVLYLSVPISCLGIAKSIIMLVVAIERCIVAWRPAFYQKYSKTIPTFIIVIFSLFYGTFGDFILYIFCGLELNITSTCFVFGCAINRSLYTYWTTHKVVIFAFSTLFSLFLCVKIFMMRRTSLAGNTATDMTNLNRFVLLDTLSVLLFYFLPSFIAIQWSKNTFFSFENLGPFGVVARQVGVFIESIIIWRVLIRRKLGTSEGCNNSSSQFFNFRVKRRQRTIVAILL